MEQIALQLAERGYSVVPNFIPAGLLAAAQADLQSLHRAGSFTRAGLGAGKTVRDEVRRDEIFWLNPDRANETQTELLAVFGRLRTVLNAELFAGIRDFEFHYAAYPAGGFYQRHSDCIRGKSTRVISAILYLNSAWKPSDGGRLRLYAPGGEVDVDPVGGTLACFTSADLEHEVLESHAPRFSLTGWFRKA